MPLDSGPSRSEQSRIVRLRSPHLEVDVAPQSGGRVVQIRHLETGTDFLWNNAGLSLTPLPPGSEYDPNFFGGIDELLPNDLPERIDGVACADHGELWTTPLDCHQESDTRLTLRGQLPLFGLKYDRRMALRSETPVIDLHYRISNVTSAPRHFHWKMHAAMVVEQGDVIECPAQHTKVADLAYSRFGTLDPFEWPHIEGQDASLVPARNGTVDFFYLYDLRSGRIAVRRPARQVRFEYEFDAAVFPCAWIFASYGGFLGHYTVILEPCTAMPMGVNAAIARGHCRCLEPGEALETDISIYAGPIA